MRRLAATAALAALLLGAPAVSHAASFDPDLTWRTMETPHFRITFHGGLEQIAEETVQKAVEVLQIPKRPTQQPVEQVAEAIGPVPKVKTEYQEEIVERQVHRCS